jgi:SAM-dependent methyltransferase
VPDPGRENRRPQRGAAGSVDPVPDAAFADPRLARTYDPLDPDRSDLDVYAAMVVEFGARRVLDVGCGTGTFACLLALRGVTVTAVDPAAASLDVARGKPGADRVRWILGDATSLPPLQVDMATMTANVAQVFVSDKDLTDTLRGIRATLRPGGRLVFETRDPARKAWLEWDREHTDTTADIPGEGMVRSWCDLISVQDGPSSPLVSFRWTTEFASDGAVVVSDSTLRFRNRTEIQAALRATGFHLDEVRDAPDRPGRELVFVAVAAP